MLKYLIAMCLWVLLSFSNLSFAQNLNLWRDLNDNIRRSKQIKSYMLGKSLKDYLYYGFLEKAKLRVFDYIDVSEYKSDTLIFVEIYSMTTSGYTCSFYSSNRMEYLSIHINRGDFNTTMLPPNSSCSN